MTGRESANEPFSDSAPIYEPPRCTKLRSRLNRAALCNFGLARILGGSRINCATVFCTSALLCGFLYIHVPKRRGKLHYIYKSARDRYQLTPRYHKVIKKSFPRLYTSSSELGNPEISRERCYTMRYSRNINLENNFTSKNRILRSFERKKVPLDSFWATRK